MSCPGSAPAAEIKPAEQGEQDDRVEITIYLWDKSLSKQLTPWLEKQFPDIKFTFVVGYEATRRIRTLKDPALAEIPILAMTANAFDEDRRAAAACGMNGFLSKPINLKEVIQTLQSVFYQT